MVLHGPAAVSGVGRGVLGADGGPGPTRPRYPGHVVTVDRLRSAAAAESELAVEEEAAAAEAAPELLNFVSRRGAAPWPT